jgi:hypothetical protein
MPENDKSKRVTNRSDVRLPNERREIDLGHRHIIGANVGSGGRPPADRPPRPSDTPPSGQKKN